MRITSVAHAVFAATLIAVGILGLLQRDVAAIWQPLPPGVPARELLAYLCASISIGSGIGLLWPRAAAAAAGTLLVWLPIVVAGPTNTFQWNGRAISLALTAAARVVADSYCDRPWLAISGTR